MKENHILIGLGGTGGKVLKAFRKRLYQEYNDDERLNFLSPSSMWIQAQRR